MKLKKILFIFLVFVLFKFSFADYNGTVFTNQSDLSFEQLQGYDLIWLKGGHSTQSISAPQLSVKELRYIIPIDVNVSNISITSSNKTQIIGSYNMYPYQTEHPLDGSVQPPFDDPDSLNL